MQYKLESNIYGIIATIYQKRSGFCWQQFLSSAFKTTELNTVLTRVSNDTDQEVSSDLSYGVRQTPE